ncbi:MAG: ribosome maturation factor RimM [Hyphococcus sp.]
MTAPDQTRVCLGVFIGAHGVKGAAQVKTFTEAPENIAAYGPVQTEDGARLFSLTVLRVPKPGIAIVTAPEIKSREDAQALKGARLYVDRTMLPAPAPDSFYIDDLVGLDVTDETGAPAGRIKAVYNFGAGDLLEIENIPGAKGVRLIPFTRDAVPRLDIDARRIVIAAGALAEEDAAPETGPADSHEGP